MVGSRAARGWARQLARDAVRVAAQTGWSIVSGGAVGVDVTAHMEALQVGVGQTVVLPLGPDRVYPPEHGGLFETIAGRDDSGVVFGQRRGVEPTRGMFASRNRVIVQLADAVLVAQAAARSGSRGTGVLALRQGCVTAAGIGPGSRGGAALVAAGAVAVRDASEVAAWLGTAAGHGPPPPRAAWPEHLLRLHDALASAPVSGLTVDEVADPLRALCDLTEASALGLVVEPTPGRYVLVDRARKLVP